MSIEQKLFDQINENSGYWFSKSADIHRSARVLWEKIENGDSIGYIDVYKMLEGMAFETMAKAFCIAKGKQPRTNQKLTALFSDAGFKLTKKENQILEVLTSYIEWAGKYPSPKVNEGAKALISHYNSENNLACPIDYSALHKLWLKFSDKYMADHNA
ncbi:hypothetical protein NRL00_09865 [Aeromonas dhakensis]|uniref:hypothetical protein n=1 Tax=Aeromonas dhakensis TaxID=196024 RepID=UPI00227D214C|nr:hypothetical protein [Aeromonas dhakensis]WAF78850.1 hypothetical protein NRL00_09865 [Aeromonas dhakensis]